MGQGARICVVDDEPSILRLLQGNLAAKGYEVLVAESGPETLELIVHRPPDIFVIDMILPGMSGLELIRHVREQSAAPIIVLSGIGDERSKVEALDQGADDYVTKPFSVEELHARIKAGMRRAAGAQSVEPIFTSGDLSVNFDRREVRLNGQQVKMTPTEYDLLKYMVQNVGRPLTHRMLLTAVWGPGYHDKVQYLRVFMGHLRKKLETNSGRPPFIVTDPGIGYRFSADTREESPE